MSIAEAILFVATNSQVCEPCLKFVSQTRLPVKVVRLDTPESRNIAANGKYFQIVSVPTMVIVYEDGNTQLFLGMQKIIQWLSALIKSRERPAPASSSKPDRTMMPQEQNMYGPLSSLYPTPRRTIEEEYDEGPRVFHRNTPERVFEPEFDEPNNEEYQEKVPAPVPPARRTPKKPTVVEDYSDDEVALEVEEEPKPKPRKSKKASSKTRRSKKVQDDTDEVETSAVAANRKMAREKLNKVASAKSAPLESRMKGIYNIARQMEQDRTGSLGYKEEELPHY